MKMLAVSQLLSPARLEVATIDPSRNTHAFKREISISTSYFAREPVTRGQCYFQNGRSQKLKATAKFEPLHRTVRWLVYDRQDVVVDNDRMWACKQLHYAFRAHWYVSVCA